jgi:hypothetical protein
MAKVSSVRSIGTSVTPTIFHGRAMSDEGFGWHSEKTSAEKNHMFDNRISRTIEWWIERRPIQQA